MADNLTKAQRRKNMRNIRSSGTKPELLLMQELKRSGIKFRKHAKSLPGRPDIVLDKKKLAVFVDGCFWHGCKRCYVRPKTDRTYWDAKVKNNKNRDRRHMRELRKSGWAVVRFWEHSIRKAPLICAKKLTNI